MFGSQAFIGAATVFTLPLRMQDISKKLSHCIFIKKHLICYCTICYQLCDYEAVVLKSKMAFAVSGFILSALLSPVSGADWALNGASPVEGSWRNRLGLSYVFDNSGIMTQTVDDKSFAGQKTFKYELITSGMHKLIKYYNGLSDCSETTFLMVTDLTDSTATFAHGLAFSRKDSGSGLKGDWLHVDDLSIITWHIDHEIVAYRHETLDLQSGAFAVLEDRTGTYSMGHRIDDAGMVYVDFNDGSSVVVFPLLFKDVMYLFDFSRIRSSFFRTGSRHDLGVISETMQQHQISRFIIE